MKKKLRIISIILAIFLAIPLLSSHQLALTKIWVSGFVRTLFTVLDVHDSSRYFPTARAAHTSMMSGYMSWPEKSQIFKQIDGSTWLMPFEVFSLQFHRNQGAGYYTDGPTIQDFNADGLPDMMYSRYTPPRGTTCSPYWTACVPEGASLRQYLLTRTPSGGFYTAYRCVMERKNSGNFSPDHYIYYGDCADTSVPIDQNFIPHVINDMGSKKPLFFNPYADTGWARGSFDGDIILHDIDQADCPHPYLPLSVYSTGDCDRPLAKILDVNGDQLPDVTIRFTYQHLVGSQWQSRVLSFILYNNGHGFQL